MQLFSSATRSRTPRYLVQDSEVASCKRRYGQQGSLVTRVGCWVRLASDKLLMYCSWCVNQ